LTLKRVTTFRLTALLLISMFLLAFVSSTALPVSSGSASGIIVVVRTNASHYSGVERIRVSGMLLFTPTTSFDPSFPVHITITNPKGAIVASTNAHLTYSHKFRHTFLSGLSADWISGIYKVTASYPVCMQEPPICVLEQGATSFTYSSSG
jgi:hypothetical protein